MKLQSTPNQAPKNSLQTALTTVTTVLSITTASAAQTIDSSTHAKMGIFAPRAQELWLHARQATIVRETRMWWCRQFVHKATTAPLVARSLVNAIQISSVPKNQSHLPKAAWPDTIANLVSISTSTFVRNVYPALSAINSQRKSTRSIRQSMVAKSVLKATTARRDRQLPRWKSVLRVLNVSRPEQKNFLIVVSAHKAQLPQMKHQLSVLCVALAPQIMKICRLAFVKVFSAHGKRQLTAASACLVIRIQSQPRLSHPTRWA